MRILVFLLILLSLKAQATETLHFDMFLWGDKIGDLTISKTEREDGTQYYVLDSKLKAKVLWIIRENTAHMETTFKGGKLISSYQKEIEDGKVKRENRVTFDGSKYVVDGYKGKRTFSEAPTFSVALIYFQTMANVPKVFHEPEAEFCPIEKVDDNTWQFKSSDGSRNVYHYQNGKAVGMEFHVSIATVKLVKAP
jgi:hypothetical protein